MPDAAATSRIAWPSVILRAREVVESYDTSVTLRQLFYRLVSEQLIPNTTAAYKRLSELTAEERRHGEFPDLIDRGRQIHVPASWSSPGDAMEALIYQYRIDRTAGQDVSLYLGVEKAGLVIQLQSWFGNLGVPVLALGGYSSQTYVDEVAADVRRQARAAVLLYAGDHDPSGEDIDRDFEKRSACWDKVIRVALTASQVDEYQLPPNPGKATDSRAAGFIARHGALVQVELDALDPDDLRDLFTTAIEPFWDTSPYDIALARETADRHALEHAARSLPQPDGGAT